MEDKRKEQEIRQLIQSGMEGDEHSSRPLLAVSRARRQVGQRDTLAFALVRVWSVLARLLAPVFAFFGEKQAQAVYRQGAGKRQSNTEIQEGENHDR